MNKILSINNKFFKIKPKELIQIINKYNKDNVQGFEIYVDNFDEIQYVYDMIDLSDGKYLFNLHSKYYDNIKDELIFLNFAVNISKKLNKNINIVYHPIIGENQTDSINKTCKKLNEIFEIISKEELNEYITISNENLNKLNGKERLRKESFYQLFYKFEKLKFTFDIGHEIVDEIYTDDLDDIFQERLSNVHIHTYNRTSKIDHYPIIDLDNEKNVKVLLNKYCKDKTVVLEYALDYIEGNSLEEKIKNYINYAKII